MNYLKIDTVIKLSEDQYLLKNKNLELGITSYFYQDETFKGECYFYKTLDVRSGLEKIYALSNLQNYKQFLYLLKKTKKVSTKLLAAFSELPLTEKLLVLEGKQKIKGLARSGLDQLEGKILEDEIGNQVKIVEIKRYQELLNLYSKDLKKVTSFIQKNINKLEQLKDQDIINLFLKNN